jgi:SAM-dependent methyltransferase
MINNLKQKIERKRNSNNLIWKFLVLAKDISWAFSEFFGNKENRKNKKENEKTIDHIFEQIYKENAWQYGSGEGSLPQNTKEYRKFLQNFLKTYKIKTVLDLGCGDWQFSKFIDWNGINYIGVDVVGFIIEENIKKYSKKNINFYKKDLLTGDLPKADLIILKDVLQHLTNKNILNFLPKLKDYKFALLINSFAPENVDCKDGEFRSLNLKKSPFNLKAKEVLFYNDKQVLLVKN